MCGIFGVMALGPHGEELLDAADVFAVEASLDLLRHRGPDQRGVLHDERAVVGNTRLRIVDLSDAARLPMANDDGSVWLAFNGEITNFRALRDEHALAAHFQLRSGSDAEVLLRLYERLGIGCLDLLSGVFAFCLVDRRRRRAWLVRDFFGARPLYVSARHDRLWFSSEIKALLAAPGFRPDLDLEGFHHYLGLGYFPGESTPFVNVREVRAGHLVEVDLDRGTHETRRYFRPRYEPDESMTEGEAVRDVRAAMRDSVARNLVSDAPLGLTLSGGVDTTSILALARDVVGPAREIHTFSIVMDEPSFDESRWQRLAVERFGTAHHSLRVGPEAILDDLETHLAFLDEPTADGAAIPTFALARAASPYVRTLLSGEGGDEVFNAYETHLAHRMRALYRRWVPGPVRGAAARAAAALPCSYRKLSFDFLAKRFTRGAELHPAEAHYFWRHVCTDDEQRALLRTTATFAPTASLFRQAWDEADGPDGLDRVASIDFAHYFVDDLMTKNDRTMMAHSVATRFPMVDRLLFDVVRRVPARLRLKGLSRRYLQKEAMRPYLPESIRRRTNMGLELPHSRWFLGPLRPLVERLLARDNVERTGLLRHEPVARMWAAHQAREVDFGRPLWAIINVLVWFDLFVGGRAGALRDRLRAPS